MREMLFLRGGLAGFSFKIEQGSGPTLDTLLRMDDTISFLADKIGERMFKPSGDFFADRKEILGVVDALADTQGLDKKHTKALTDALRVLSMRSTVGYEHLFFTNYRPFPGSGEERIEFVANVEGWVAVKKINAVGKSDVDILLFLSSIEDSLRRRIYESVRVDPAPRRRASRSALRAILDQFKSLKDDHVRKTVWLRRSLEVSGMPVDYGVAFQHIKPRVRGRKF